MTKTKAALATMLMALSMAFGVGGASPAAAATESCANYPPGQAYTVTASPLNVTVRRGGFTRVYATVKHGSAVCGGAKVNLSFRYGNSTTWRCCITAYTNSLGLAGYKVNVSPAFQMSYFRYYWRFVYPGGSTISGYGLIRVVPAV